MSVTTRLKPLTRACAILALLARFAGAPASNAHGAELLTERHHDITLSLDPPSHKVSARDRIDVMQGGTLTFYLSDLFVLEGVRVDGVPVPVQRDGAAIRVETGAPTHHTVTFRYQGRLPDISMRALNGFALSAQGGYLSDGWFPRLSDAPFGYDLHLDIPLPDKAVALGTLVTHTQHGGRYRASFRSSAPARELAVFCGPYAISERPLARETNDATHKGAVSKNAIALRTYFSPPLASLADGYLDFTARYIRRYSRQIGAYPYDGFAIVSAPLPVGLGFAGLTYIGADVLKLPFIRYTSLGHEILHNWWGNAVDVDYAQGNWAEGLTTFMADYTFAEDRSDRAARDMRLQWLRNYAALPPDRDRPAVDFISKNHDASQVVGYNKVAFFFVMLRAQIGKDAFARAIRLFWKDNRFKTAGWDDLRRAFETASGQDLGPFFSQWLRRTGAPSFAVDAAQVRKDAGGYRVSFTLRQNGTPYRVRLPITIATASGSRRFVVTARRSDERFTLNLAERPLSLQIDPNFEVFRHLAPGEATPILRDVTLDPRSETLIVGHGAALQAQAWALSARLLGPNAPFKNAGAAPLPAAPLLVIGTEPEISRFIETRGIPPLPPRYGKKGTAWVWATRTLAGHPIVIVRARTASDLSKIVRAVPHYRRRGYIVFDGARAVESGNWPIKPGALKVRFGALKKKTP